MGLIYGDEAMIAVDNRIRPIGYKEFVLMDDLISRESYDEMCTYDEAFTIQEMLEETGQCKDCKLNCPNAGKSE